MGTNFAGRTLAPIPPGLNHQDFSAGRDPFSENLGPDQSADLLSTRVAMWLAERVFTGLAHARHKPTRRRIQRPQQANAPRAPRSRYFC
jgi:hypothetical protein